MTQLKSKSTLPKPGNKERSKNPKIIKKGRPRKLLSQEELQTEEARFMAIGRGIVAGTLLNATKDSPMDGLDMGEVHKYRHKRSVIIECAADGCYVQRRIATSDLAQVILCEECTRVARNARKRDRRRVARAAKRAN